MKAIKLNCLDWGKVVELILKVIPYKNIDKIKRASNSTKLNEYKTLVNFLMSKISYSYKSRIAYINYWETPKQQVLQALHQVAVQAVVAGREENPGCLIASIIGAIILMILIFSNY